jgi:IS66 C-terminal element
MYKLIATAKLNNIDPQAWLADALRRTADHPARRLLELSPGTGRPRRPNTPPRKYSAIVTADRRRRCRLYTTSLRPRWMLIYCHTGCVAPPATGQAVGAFRRANGSWTFAQPYVLPATPSRRGD